MLITFPSVVTSLVDGAQWIAFTLTLAKSVTLSSVISLETS